MEYNKTVFFRRPSFNRAYADHPPLCTNGDGRRGDILIIDMGEGCNMNFCLLSLFILPPWCGGFFLGTLFLLVLL